MKSVAVALDRIRAVLEPILKALSYQWYGCEYVTDDGPATLRIYIDAEEGVKVSDCQKVSRQAAALLEVEGLLPGNRVRLEISSPGLERPLFTRAHYEAQCGNPVKVKLAQVLDGRRKFFGVLRTVDDAGISVEEAEGKTTHVPWQAIAKTRLVFLGMQKR